jgi:hypothetical protein
MSVIKYLKFKVNGEERRWEITELCGEHYHVFELALVVKLTEGKYKDYQLILRRSIYDDYIDAFNDFNAQKLVIFKDDLISEEFADEYGEELEKAELEELI